MLLKKLTEYIKTVFTRDVVKPRIYPGSFWSLRPQACVLVTTQVVMQWTMHCPKGLTGQTELNPERR